MSQSRKTQTTITPKARSSSNIPINNGAMILVTISFAHNKPFTNSGSRETMLLLTNGLQRGTN